MAQTKFKPQRSASQDEVRACCTPCINLGCVGNTNRRNLIKLKSWGQGKGQAKSSYGKYMQILLQGTFRKVPGLLISQWWNHSHLTMHSLLAAYKHSLNDLAFFGQFCHELEVRDQLVIGLFVPVQQFLGIIDCLEFQHVQVAVHGRGEAAAVLGNFHIKVCLLKHARILLHSWDGRECHKAQESLSLSVRQTFTLDPVSKHDFPSGLHNASGLVNNELFVRHVAPSILAVHKIGRGIGESVLQ
mmetsp:Transcript_88291/g.108101  ORF Transcript_88291/g.108101 Transcript_88291/m.108101 type:complete len:244 (-) Transcript_88291:400-1131(-)